jgi:hypothetical protein
MPPINRDDTAAPCFARAPLPSQAAWDAFIAAKEEIWLLANPHPGSNRPVASELLIALANTKATHDLLHASGRSDLASVDYRTLQNLKDIQDGHTSALDYRGPQASGHRNWEAALIATSARAIDALLKAHKTLEEAAKEVWPLVRRQMPGVKKWETVRRWRFDLKKSHSPMPQAAVQRYRAPAPPDCPTEPEAAAAYWLGLLEHSPALRRPR